jgi:hypothetical protein
MKPSTRRAMRVATVFTGAAAAATGFGPAAMAAPVHQAQPAFGKISGSIRDGSCRSEPHWLQLAQRIPGTQISCIAYGFRGEWSEGGAFISSQCGGTNYGFLKFTSGKTISYGPGNYFRAINKDMRLITIDGWTGNDNCQTG